MHPRIQLIFNGALVSVQFGDAVALCARGALVRLSILRHIVLLTILFKDVNYRDRLELKTATDRTLGVGVSPNDGALIVLTAGMMMKVSIHLDKILAYDLQ